MRDFKEILHDTADFLVRCLYPERCSVCGKIIPLNEKYCVCSRQISVKISDSFCPHCGYDKNSCVCEKGNTLALPNIAAVYIYSGRVKADIHGLKFDGKKRLAVKLGTKMAERAANAYSDKDFDIVTYVPMSKLSQNKRGYNQSFLLARQVGKMLFVPVEDLLVKTRETAVQHELSGQERILNVKDSVKAKENADIMNKKILLCDDVKTTGATFNQCVKALLSAGAEEVNCLCAALSDFSN